MCGYPVSRCVLVFVFFSLLKESHLTFHENSHGFLSQDKYLVEDISYHEGFSAGAISPVINDLNLKYLLKFDPEQLDFQQRPLGVPHIEKVTLHNVHDNRSIDMTSISGSTVHFHSSFFEDKKIPPLGNTTFNVVFLGREEGAIQSDLFIHTTEGRFKYQVKGASVHSPYRLRPIVNVKLPINATFSPFIYMYNPRAEPIQIVEMYSSGGDFHLELPSGEMEGPKDMWEILPYETKAIIRVRFHARSEQNHTAYVRIKLKNSEEVLVVPLEVEVTSSASLFTPRGFVDFGIGGSMDGAKTVPLYVQNPLKKLLRVQSVTSTSPVVTVDLQETRVPADKGKGDQIVKIANLTVDWLKAFETKDYSGKIVIKYKNNRTCTEIPFYVTLQEGGLTYETNGIQYFIDEIPEKVKPKNVLLKNKYSVPVLLLNVTLEPNLQSHFSVTNFQPTTLEPSEEAEVFSLKLKSGKTLPQSKVTSSLTVRTNVSEITIPVCCYNGKVDLVLPFVNGASSLNLGLISSNTAKTVHFLISNKNPIDIHMKRVKTSIPSAIVDLIGCFSGNPIETLMQETHKNLTKCSILEADNFAIFRLTIETFSAEGQIWGDVTLETQYEQLSIPVHFKIAHGKLEIGPDRLVFDQCFPAKICSHPIRVHSTFPEPMTVEEVVPLPPDPRITYRHVGRIQPKTTKVIGHLYLDPTVECKNECYAGLQHDTTAQWLRTLMLSEGASEFDVNLINLFYNRYMNQTANGTRKWQNLTMKLETSEVKAHIFRTRVKMSWPSLLADQNMLENRSVYTMPLVQVENVSLQNITIRNPSNYNLVVQVVLERYYPELENLYEGLPSTFVPQKLPRFRRPSNRFFFAGDYQKLQENFRNSFDLPFDKKSVPLLIKPGQNATVTIGYKVEDTLPTTGLVFLRNNLTIIELLILKGRGAQQNFKFGNRRPGSMQPLAFELLDKHLRECERGNQGTKFIPPTITVKRTFTARNMGDLPVDVYGFYINGLPCEGYGFKVLNCEPFVLPPNGTRKIDIACTPDFTLAKITRDLVLDTSLNFPVNYTLVTTVPAYYLPLCTNAIARPTWEGYFYFVAVFLMSSLLAFAMLTPIIDSERIVKHTLGLLVSRNCVNAEPTLDLRLIGQQTRCEIRQKIEVDCGAEKKVEKEVISKEIKEVLKEVAKETAKAKSLDLIEDLKVVKEEPTEKSSVLIPVPPRQKKKLSKKSSNELPPETTSTKKPESPNNNNNINLLQEKPQKQPTKTDPIPDEVRKMEAKELKKLILPKVKLLKAEECPVGLHEEETSSTTTESSSNNEEEKGVRGAVAKQQPVKVAACEETPVKVEKRKVGPLKVRKEKEGYEKNENHRERFHSDGRRRNKYVRERKEKHSSNKLQKKVFDFSCLMNHKEKANTTPTTNVWSEKRATFSDVVSSSRNDTIPIYQPTTTTTPKITSPILLTPSPPLVSTIPPQQQQPQRTPSPPPPPPPKPLTPVLSTPPQPPPILFRQPHHFKPSDSLITNHTDHCEQRAELGPIGSRKHDGFHLQDAPLVPAVINGSNPVQEEACQTLRMSSSSNSLFSDGKRSLLSEMPNPFLDFWNGDEWEQKCCAGGGLLQGKANGANATGNLQGGGTWTYNTNPNGLRDNLYTPPSEVTSPPAERTSSQAGYLWGSSSVWQPWAPEKPKTPTRMPPGFTHREIEMQIQQRVQHQQQQQQQQQQQNDLYNPFSSSNIWTSHPWEYNPEQ